jgi:hypothetical protein
MSVQRQRRISWHAIVLAMVLLCGIEFSARAATVGAGAVVVVNSSSPNYPDFQHYLQPYLGNFGVPYTVLDIASNSIGANIGNYALIIIGHKQLDTNLVYLTGAAQSNLSLAVSNGTGLVSFDSVLSATNGSNYYQYAQSIFGFGYTNSTQGTSVTIPPTEAGGQMHFITSRHPTNDTILLSNKMTVAGITLASNTVAISNAESIAFCGGAPFMIVEQYGAGRAVQWTSYDWMAVSVKGPVAGLDDLVWRSFVWAARKPFVMRGLPNFVTLRIDDVAGPLWWAHTAINAGFKPWLGMFFQCVTPSDTADLRSMVTNGQATASVHSFGCINNTNQEWIYWNWSNSTNYPDNVISNNMAQGLGWFQSNNIPMSPVIYCHYSEIGPNAFPWLKAWGIQYIGQKNPPGTARDSPWLVAGPYRLYETPLLGSTLLPVHYADFLTIPGHPELNGQFFNIVTEIRDDAPCGEWCPDNNVTNSIGKGTRQLKRALDSLVLATLYSHEWYIHPTQDVPGYTAITSNDWTAIIQGITNNLASYNPLYVTVEYACQYVRATKTYSLAGGSYDTVSGAVTATVSGNADLQTSIDIFTGQDSGITNFTASVPPFTNTSMAVSAYMPGMAPPPLLTGALQGNLFAISFNSAPGQGYVVQACDTPDMEKWSVLTNFTASATNTTIYDTVGALPEKFYRVLVTDAVTLTGSLQGTQFVLVFNGQTGRSYTVEYSDIFGVWNTLTNLTGQGTNVSITNPISSPRRLFRVSTPPN